MLFPVSKAAIIPRKGGELPPLRTQAKNLVQSLATAGVYFAKTGRVKRTPEEIAEISPICEDCDKYLTKEGRCSLCGCFKGFAQWLLTKHCPIGKW